MFTKQSVVNTTGENIVAQTVCKSIVVGEDESVAGWPTIAWLWRGPDSTDFKGKTAGTKEEFTKPGGVYWQPNEVVCFIKAASGSSTFTQAEQ